MERTAEDIVNDQNKKKKKLESKKLKEQELKEDQEYLNEAFFFFYYEKTQGSMQLRDFRLLLRNAYCNKYHGTKVCEIPKIAQIDLKYNQKYNVIFENLETFVEIDPTFKFSKHKFQWLKNIEEGNHEFT